jgi:hypothetical protein
MHRASDGNSTEVITMPSIPCGGDQNEHAADARKGQPYLQQELTGHWADT